jgi:hypothetical protein
VRLLVFNFLKRKVDPVQYKELYQEVFGSESGKYVLADLCNKFHMMTAIRNDEFKNGERNVMLFILAQVDADLNKLRENRQQYQLEKISYDDRNT